MRRRLSIPNPFSQLDLSRFVERHWVEFDRHMDRSRMSISRPVCTDAGDRGRALKMRAFDVRPKERVDRISRARYTLIGDISNFYGSIYTHALDWALHTREVAKAGRTAKGEARLGETLDVLIRNGCEGQTKGIPIGPDTSLLAAEILLCRVDEMLVQQHPHVGRFGIRYGDDFEFTAKTRGDAEEILLAWDSLLRQFDLAINPGKTRIIEGPLTPESPWSVVLSSHLERVLYRRGPSSDVAVARELRNLFTLALEFSAQYPGDSVLKYAISSITRAQLPLSEMAWSQWFQLLLSAAIAEPSTLQYVARELRRMAQLDLHIDRDRLEESMNELIAYHAPLEHGSEVAWSLQIIKDLNCRVDGEAAAKVAHMQDNGCLVLLMDLIENGRVSGASPDMALAEERAEREEVWKGEDWLLAYEFARNGWSHDARVREDVRWSELLDSGVSFYEAIGARKDGKLGVNIPWEGGDSDGLTKGGSSSADSTSGEYEFSRIDDDDDYGFLHLYESVRPLSHLDSSGPVASRPEPADDLRPDDGRREPHTPEWG